MISRRFILLVSGTLSRLLPPQIPPPSSYECELYLKQPLTSPNARSLLLTAPQIVDLPLKLDGGQLPLSLEIIDACRSCSQNVVENKAHFVLECPLCNFIRNKFQTLLRIQYQGVSSISFNENIKLILASSHGGYHILPLQRIYHIAIILMYFLSHKPLGFPNFEINSFN